MALLLAVESLLRLSWVYLPAGTRNEDRKRPAGAVPRCIAGSAGTLSGGQVMVLAVMQALVW